MPRDMAPVLDFWTSRIWRVFHTEAGMWVRVRIRVRVRYVGHHKVSREKDPKLSPNPNPNTLIVRYLTSLA